MKKIVGIEDNYPSKDRTFRVEWNLGKRCNYDCSYCSPSIHDKTSEHIRVLVVEKTVKKLVEHARQQNKRIRISLTGGEPFVHPQFFEILEKMKNHGVDRLSVTSNGSVSAKKYISSLKWLDYIILSIHFEFTSMNVIFRKLVEIKEFIKNKTNPDQSKGFHVHLMALPGKIKNVISLKNQLDEADISVIIRRIRPQFNKSGLFVLPFESGLSGGHKSQWDLIRKKNRSYYSNEELILLGASI